MLLLNESILYEYLRLIMKTNNRNLNSKILNREIDIQILMSALPIEQPASTHLCCSGRSN